MTTERFNALAGATAVAMFKVWELVRDGHARGDIKCPKCGATIRFTGDVKRPDRHAGSCTTPRCIRWATQ
jgi:hypothetical protein